MSARKCAESDVALFMHGGERYVVLAWPLAEPTPRLTPAENEVARLIVRGLSNAEIARERGCALRTIANQVASILGKLGAASRHHVAQALDNEE